MFFDMSDKQSLTTKVYTHIRDGILDGSYKIGDLLIETRLADELEVSRTPIREALKQLELEGLVQSIPNRGVRVQGISDDDLSDIYTIRLLLEGQAAYWAAERIDTAQLDKLAETVELMELYTRKNDVPHLAQLDSEFHDVLYSAANSRMLKQVLASLHQNARRARRSSLNEPLRPADSLREHRAIFMALESHDPEQAKQAMEQHLHNAHLN
ncbi:MAG: GntR family transcriptional regulator [Christensenellaceae bacterium]|jgi:DNA-binding GntR family transcriptional regulator|nr:GntR family transcriptional regulator [Christensenellaceae bacterium]